MFTFEFPEIKQNRNLPQETASSRISSWSSETKAFFFCTRVTILLLDISFVIRYENVYYAQLSANQMIRKYFQSMGKYGRKLFFFFFYCDSRAGWKLVSDMPSLLEWQFQNILKQFVLENITIFVSKSLKRQSWDFLLHLLHDEIFCWKFSVCTCCFMKAFADVYL